MEKPLKILAVVGPTASGKSALAVKLAKALDGEIVSADSMQIYTGMDIATAKPTPEEMEGVPHHLIDFVPPTRRYSVADYVVDAKRIIAGIAERGRLPIVAGGTGLYVDALVGNRCFDDAGVDEEVRARLQKELACRGPEEMYRKLAALDPELAEKLHQNNTGRVLRALETMEVTGQKMSELQRRAAAAPKLYDACYLGIEYSDRELLYNRINRRVDRMVEQGLISEALAFYTERREYQTAQQAIGYKELADYFEGNCTLEEGLENLKKRTRNYAKRQLTWFRRNRSIHWIDAGEQTTDEEIFQRALEIARRHLGD